MKRLRPTDYTRMAWKNGLGATTEIYRHDAPDGTMLWRVSIAGVAEDGPFSVFEGYDRHIMTIAGRGMVLEGGPDGPIRVAPTFEPAFFSGDWTITARLLGGAVRDFNLIARRGHVRARLGSIYLTSPWESEPGQAEMLFHVLSGRPNINGQTCEAGDTVILAPGEQLTAVPGPDGARLAVCEVQPAGDQ